MKYTLKIAITSVLGVALLLMTACSEGDSGTSETIDIGVLAPTTGFMSGHGTSIVMGAELAANEINGNGGIMEESRSDFT